MARLALRLEGLDDVHVPPQEGTGDGFVRTFESRVARRQTAAALARFATAAGGAPLFARECGMFVLRGPWTSPAVDGCP